MLAQEIDRKTRMSEETQRELRQKIENLKAQIDQLGEQITMQQGFFKTISDEYNLFQWSSRTSPGIAERIECAPASLDAVAVQTAGARKQQASA